MPTAVLGAASMPAAAAAPVRYTIQLRIDAATIAPCMAGDAVRTFHTGFDD